MAGHGGTCSVLHYFHQDFYGKDTQCAIKVIKFVEKYDIAATQYNKEPR